METPAELKAQGPPTQLTCLEEGCRGALDPVGGLLLSI